MAETLEKLLYRLGRWRKGDSQKVSVGRKEKMEEAQRRGRRNVVGARVSVGGRG